MNYIKSLIISILIHSLAFAGTWAVWDHLYGNNSQIVDSYQSVTMVWGSPDQNQKLSFQKPKKARISAERLSSKPKKLSSPMADATQSKTLAKVVGAASGDLFPDPSNQPPVYPETAQRQGLRGQLLLQLTINAHGQVANVVILKGAEVASILRDSAIHTVKTWRFRRKNNHPVLVTVNLPIVFDLDE